MTKKECILDSLIDDAEAKTQIKEYFKLDNVNIDITENELDTLLSEMVTEGLIVVYHGWKNEKDEYPYMLTKKGRMVWENIKKI